MLTMEEAGPQPKGEGGEVWMRSDPKSVHVIDGDVIDLIAVYDVCVA
jgi:hypothetical protein